MNLNIQMQLKNNPLYLDYLHAHSYWYKILNRYPEKFKDFIEEVKNEYHLRPADKIKKTLDTVDMLSSLLSAFKS